MYPNHQIDEKYGVAIWVGGVVQICPVNFHQNEAANV
jgi:hypothetical protein